MEALSDNINTVQRYCEIFNLLQTRVEFLKESLSLFQTFFNVYILERRNNDDNGLQNILVLFIMVNNALFCEHEYLQKGMIFNFNYQYLK